MRMMDTCRRWMLFLTVLTASASAFVHTGNQKLDEAQEIYWPNPEPCFSVRPEDVAVLSAVGLPYTLGSDGHSVMNHLHDFTSIFSPELISVLPENTVQFSNLVNQAKHTVTLLNNQQPDVVESGWKLLFLFVPFDRLCACDTQVTIAVQEVDEAVQVLQSRLKKAIISVVLYFADSGHGRRCHCDSEAKSDGELRLMSAIHTHVMLESLKEKLLDRAWYHREDFTLRLRDRPLSSHLIYHTKQRALEENRDHTLALQLWENLLLPTSGKRNNGKYLAMNCASVLNSKPVKKYVVAHGPRKQGGRGTEVQIMGTELNCEEMSPSTKIPTSVHEVRPADIRVVAATGDSITAGNGVAATSLLSVLTMYRGLSWSVGGEQNISTITTIANILREFNPELTGFSLGTGTHNNQKSFLNQAVPGAKSDDMLSQAKMLVKKMKNDEHIDFHSDWKLITLFIGGNDLCDFCDNAEYYSAENFVQRIQEALDFLQAEVPRVIVNLVDPLYIPPLRALHQDPTLDCPTWLMQMLCSCVVDPEDGSQALKELEDVNRQYQSLLADLVESGRYDTKSDFTVVLQPFLRNIELPIKDGHPDQSFFTPDCFHLSQKAHTLMARGLWNNMLERLGNKTHTHGFDPDLTVLCPSKNSPFIWTSGNSKSLP